MDWWVLTVLCVLSIIITVPIQVIASTPSAPLCVLVKHHVIRSANATLQAMVLGAVDTPGVAQMMQRAAAAAAAAAAERGTDAAEAAAAAAVKRRQSFTKVPVLRLLQQP
jgi:DNA uptake protein ComE-like DNA-binding protein